MNHIVVPVDLSQNSKEALRYAARLAMLSGADIMILHCFSLIQKVVLHTKGKEELSKDPEKWIAKRIAKLKSKHPELGVQYRIFQDDVLPSLKKMVDLIHADLIVMGCQGEHENAGTFLGSTAGALVKTTELPVLLIPPRYKFKGIEKVVFAAKDTFVKFMGALEPIIQIKQIFKPHIQLLHIGQTTDSMPAQSFSILPVINDITRFGNDNFNESINEYLTQHPADLLCVIRRKRGFVEKLLGPARTSVKKFKVDLPILVLIGED